MFVWLVRQDRFSGRDRGETVSGDGEAKLFGELEGGV